MTSTPIVYDKTVENSTTFNGGQTLSCDSANLICKYASTLTEDTLTVNNNINITCEGVTLFDGSTIVLQNLQCASANINVQHNSTVHILSMECSGTCTIDIGYGSTLNIGAGSITKITGTVNNSSTGNVKATLTEDDVQSQSASTWVT